MYPKQYSSANIGFDNFVRLRPDPFYVTKGVLAISRRLGYDVKTRR